MKNINPLAALVAFVAKFQTQRDAAAGLGISQPYLGDMLKGQRRVSPRILRALGLQEKVTIHRRAS